MTAVGDPIAWLSELVGKREYINISIGELSSLIVV